MNELVKNTIERVERFGLQVVDSGSTKSPHAVRQPKNGGKGFYTVKQRLTSDQLYDFADTLDALAYVGRLTEPTV